MTTRRIVPILVAGLVAALVYPLVRPAPDIADRPVPGGIPDGPLTVAAFGTSLTARATWPDRLAAGLRECRDAPVDLVRVARPGAGSTWGRFAVARVVEAAPDVVLVEFAINDADLVEGVSLARAALHHEEIITGLQAGLPGAPIVLMTMNPTYGPRGWVRPFLRQHYRQYHRYAEAHATGLVDLYPRWLRAPAAIRRPPDGLHPSASQQEAVIVPAMLEAFGCAVESRR